MIQFPSGKSWQPGGNFPQDQVSEFQCLKLCVVKHDELVTSRSFRKTLSFFLLTPPPLLLSAPLLRIARLLWGRSDNLCLFDLRQRRRRRRLRYCLPQRSKTQVVANPLQRKEGYWSAKSKSMAPGGGERLTLFFNARVCPVWKMMEVSPKKWNRAGS